MSRKGLMVIAILLAVLAAWISRAQAATLDWSKEQVIPITGEVGTSILGQAAFIEQLMNKEGGSKTIRLMINSPGGSVIAGNIFIQAMDVARARGFKIDCVVTNMAASMAMHILAHCSNRYALSGAYLLFHEARVGMKGSYTERELRRTAHTLGAITYTLEEYLIDQLGCGGMFYREHNEGETMWAAELFALTFDKFKLKVINDLKIPAAVPGGMFDPIGQPSFDRRRGATETTGAEPQIRPSSIPWGVQ